MNQTTRNYKRKKADAAESRKESTVSAYSVSRPRNQLGCAFPSRPKVTRTKKRPTGRNPLKDFTLSAYFLSRPAASADLRYKLSSESYRVATWVTKNALESRRNATAYYCRSPSRRQSGFQPFFRLRQKAANVLFATNGRLWLARDGEEFLAYARFLHEQIAHKRWQRRS